MKKGKLRAVLSVLWLALPCLVKAGEEKCEQLSADSATRIATYIHDTFRFPPPTVLEISGVEVVGGTCFKKIRVRAKNSTSRGEFAFFLSPDHRFLARDLFDTASLERPAVGPSRNIKASDLTHGRFPTKGDDNAPLAIVIFEDFACPYCKTANEIVNQQIALNPSRVRLVFRHLPLPVHPWARAAAEMAACVFDQSNDGFWDLHDYLFANQVKLSIENLDMRVLEFLNARSDIDEKGYLDCLGKHRMSKEIEEDIIFAREHHIEGTPTLFVNGVRKEGLGSMLELANLFQEVSH